jgi:hypothetical protein
MKKHTVSRYRHFDILLALFVALLLISNVAATKLLAIGPFIIKMVSAQHLCVRNNYGVLNQKEAAQVSTLS